MIVTKESTKYAVSVFLFVPFIEWLISIIRNVLTVLFFFFKSDLLEFLRKYADAPLNYILTVLKAGAMAYGKFLENYFRKYV